MARWELQEPMVLPASKDLLEQEVYPVLVERRVRQASQVLREQPV